MLLGWQGLEPEKGAGVWAIRETAKGLGSQGCREEAGLPTEAGEGAAPGSSPCQEQRARYFWPLSPGNQTVVGRDRDHDLFMMGADEEEEEEAGLPPGALCGQRREMRFLVPPPQKLQTLLPSPF